MKTRTASILTTLSATLAGGALLTAGIVSMNSSGLLGMRQLIPTAGEKALTLHRAGITPEALAAAGASPAQAAEAFADGIDYIDSSYATLATADAAYTTARRDSDQLRRTIAAGLATQEDHAAYATAETNMDNAAASIEGVLNALYAAAVADLPQGVQDNLDTIVLNTRWDVPIQYKTINRSEAQWVTLREALANDRICDELEEEPDPNLQSTLSQANSDAAAASVALQANLTNINTEWNDAIQ